MAPHFLWSKISQALHLSFHIFLLATEEPVFFPAKCHCSSLVLLGTVRLRPMTLDPRPGPCLVLSYMHVFIYVIRHLGCSTFITEILCKAHYCHLCILQESLCSQKKKKKDNSMKGVDRGVQ